MAENRSNDFTIAAPRPNHITNSTYELYRQKLSRTAAVLSSCPGFAFSGVNERYGDLSLVDTTVTAGGTRPQVARINSNECRQAGMTSQSSQQSFRQVVLVVTRTR